jgi:hypothetical protein
MLKAKNSLVKSVRYVTDYTGDKPVCFLNKTVMCQVRPETEGTAVIIDTKCVLYAVRADMRETLEYREWSIVNFEIHTFKIYQV